jgi:hypothetical protein
MASTGSGYRRSWKRWVAIYVAVGAVAYLAIYLLLMHHGSGAGGGGFHY